MNALEWSRKKIFLWKASPVAGAFDERKYPFVIDPLASLDDIRIKETCIYGPAQSFKSVLLQIATAYRLDMRRESILLVSQTDDDVKEWAIQKMIPMLERIESLVTTTRNDRSAQTIKAWLWPTFELIMSGPGENAQNSKSVRFLHTDEAHLWCNVYPGALAALRNRMGRRWNRHALHATTAAQEGTEIDNLFYQGNQAEWHLRCVHCNELIWPLWTEASREAYNGHEVFQWVEQQSETAMLDSIHMVCPHCHKQILDDPKVRAEMDDGARYVSKNDGADISVRSFRWNAFAPRWVPWRDLFQDNLKALQSAKLGDLGPYEKWHKMQEVRSWRGEFPLLGDSTRGRNYLAEQVEFDDKELRTLSIDVQEGQKNEGFHLWCLVSSWEKGGMKSRRIAYRKLATWDDARAMQMEFRVKDSGVCVDCGDRDREVFAVCARFHWLAVKSTDEDSFAHIAVNPVTRIQTSIPLPYSTTRLESANVGKETMKAIRLPRGGRVPEGFAISRLWAKNVLYSLLYALKQGTAGREYGIPSDITQAFTDQIHSYSPALEIDKKTGTKKRINWFKVKRDDHGFICAAQELLLAIISGFYPLAPQPETQTEKAA